MSSHLFVPQSMTVKQLTQTTQFTHLLPSTTRKLPHFYRTHATSSPNGGGSGSGSGGGDSYLGMWKKAVEREKKVSEFLKIAQNSPTLNEVVESPEMLANKSYEFQKILEVPKEERDRVQRIQVIDRAAAAIAAARAVLKDTKSTHIPTSTVKSQPSQVENRRSNSSGNEAPGPEINFWSWTPPPPQVVDPSNAQRAPKTTSSVNLVLEKDRSMDILSIPFQSFMEVHQVQTSSSIQESSVPQQDIDAQFPSISFEAANALHNVDEKPTYGINEDGSRWWKETGVEKRPDGVVCRWTLNRGVTADGVVEWEEKYWEGADECDHKELGSEKCGRDAIGNVWHECWKESMWEEQGVLHMEKTADKWGKNGKGDEWQEKWFEHYDDSGKTDKWAHKWCSIDTRTVVDVGHAHVWNERWGEKYDGLGGSIKYTDKWAERFEGDAWVKWGDKWDENFDQNGHGVKQGETWWQGKYGQQWNRTWGEQHNGSGWVHKYGKSSSGDHWDTHVQEDTWYERYPHFGFMHCLVNSVHLREVSKPSQSGTL